MQTTTPSWLEVSASAFAHNIEVYKRIVGASVDLGLVIKSNAYGHGLREIGSLAQDNAHIRWLCATSISEALALRAQGVSKPIVVMAVYDADFASAIEQDIDLIAYDMATIQELNRIGERLGKRVAIHLKIDTGLSRFGFFPDEAISVAQKISAMPHIYLRGIFTHLAEADNEDQSFTKKQLALFSTVLTAIDAHGITIPVRHAGNSAASALLPIPGGNLVRLGAGAYGLRPFPATHSLAQKLTDYSLKQVMTWKTRIMHVRSVPEGSNVGYARTHITKKPTKIALVPVGYYEGYDRRFSNCGFMLVVAQASGERARVPVIGRVCTNVTLLDVTSVPGVADGDEVIITGEMPGMHARELADIIGSYNPREITVRINPLLPRIIVS